MKNKTVFIGTIGLLSLLLFLSPSCKKQAFFADGEASITISAASTNIDLNAEVRISIVGFNEDGSLLWDGTRIEMTIENGTLNVSTVDLSDGRAEVIATGNMGRGEMKITARSGTVVAEPNPLVITVGENRVVNQITAGANPSILPYNGGRTLITARIYDANYELMPGITVIMETTAGKMDSGGAPLVTDNQGRVVDYLETQQAATVTIYAGEKDKTLEISLEDEPPVNDPPNAEFSYSPNDPISNETIYFNGSESSDTDGNIVNYSWDFGDGDTARGKRVTHGYDLQGQQYKSYSVVLTVTDDDGAQDSVSKMVTVYQKT